MANVGVLNSVLARSAGRGRNLFGDATLQSGTATMISTFEGAEQSLLVAEMKDFSNREKGTRWIVYNSRPTTVHTHPTVPVLSYLYASLDMHVVNIIQ